MTITATGTGWTPSTGRSAQVSADIDRNGLDVRLLEGGAATLGDLLARRRERLTTIEAEVTQRRRLLLDIDACLMGGRALAGVGAGTAGHELRVVRGETV